ncbi:MAG TPA: 50S ribosomal protein L11 methyltransferase, partial [Thermosynechococcaceae cyanobacterium]
MWTELSLDVTHEAIDWVKTLLATIDPQAQLRVSPCVEPDAAWAFTVRFYLPQSVRTQEIAALLSPLHRTGLTSELQIATVEAVAEDNQLPLHRISDRFVVLSSNAPYQAVADEIVLKIGTGLAFGSGLHPATIVSLRLLERHVTSNLQALDLGSGSGILSVAIAKLGSQVLA